MDLGQVVDAVIALYRRRPGLLLGLCAVLQVPAAILAGIILLPLPARLEEIVGFDPLDPPATFDPTTTLPTPSTDQLLGLLVPIWAAALVTIVAGTLTTVAVAQAVARLRLGQEATIAAALGAVLRRLAPILGALVLYTVALVGLVLLAFVAFVIPLGLAPSATAGGPLAFAAVLALAAVLVLTVFVSIRWTFWPQAVIVDETGPVASLGRSWRLVAGSTWRVIGYALLFGLAAGILQGLIAQLGLIVVDVLAGILPEAAAARPGLHGQHARDAAAGPRGAGGDDAALSRPAHPTRRTADVGLPASEGQGPKSRSSQSSSGVLRPPEPGAAPRGVIGRGDGASASSAKASSFERP